MLDLNNLGKMAQEATNLANNPMAQGILNNPAVSGFVNQAEKMTGIDLNGNGTVGAAAPIVDDTVIPAVDVVESTEETTETIEE